MRRSTAQSVVSERGTETTPRPGSAGAGAASPISSSRACSAATSISTESPTRGDSGEAKHSHSQGSGRVIIR